MIMQSFRHSCQPEFRPIPGCYSGWKWLRGRDLIYRKASGRGFRCERTISKVEEPIFPKRVLSYYDENCTPREGLANSAKITRGTLRQRHAGVVMSGGSLNPKA